MNEQDILDRAIEAFGRETGINIEVTTRNLRGLRGQQYDAVLAIDQEDYVAEIKAWAQHGNIGAVIEQVKRYPNGLLVADYINPNMADQLRKTDVQFIDAVGNAFIKTNLHHVQIKGNKKPSIERYPRNRPRALTKAGLRVVYALLLEPELVAEPYRTIADIAAVALGTVGHIVQDLETRGYLVTKNRSRRLVRVDELLQLWVERFPETLRPDLLLGTFKADDPDWWKNVDLVEFNAQWGGEIAAAMYTDYLRPVVATVYVPKVNQMQLVAAAKLRMMGGLGEQAGMVEMLAPLGRRNEQPDKVVVPPILAYADLIATADPRNIETAKIIYEERIAQRLG